MKILFLYFLIVNSLAFIIAGYDKYLAIKNKYRIPENTLFAFAAFGGSVGLLLAMLLFRHKTSKSSFIAKFSVIFLIQIVLVIARLNDKI
ncbi:DUF1294 domain-containing protein [Flavobacterium sp. ANB]|jgi:uncharacterized membrane protein YsdA (DUF1294 family)|uniref:DUF1294 domain-containing protein n=1 Tax=unclassified Flavobacterium TaxID=196869 RepID=UPI0012B81A13|nr:MULTISPECIES: DUF1294 domain-containing protein [unclassified Flavobacterium]MBF4515317.1 DUF1294 domain-containing protein [Flavobacterium sp. ANB]MTD70229.1 DUF1294 domain-containing protein [Flavobacterium sp. LC2016-13]